MMAAREGHFEERRQDLRDRAEGALRPRRRPDGQDRDAAALHHARRKTPRPTRTSRSPNTSAPARSSTTRTRPRWVSATSTTRTRTMCRARSRPRAAWPARRRSFKSTASSTRTCRLSRPPWQALQGRRNRLLRDPADRPSRHARKRSEHQGRGAQQDRQLSASCGSITCIRRSTMSMPARRCST